MNRIFKSIPLLTMVVIASAAPTRADWNPGDDHKMHWPQLPDLTPTGMDVLASQTFPATIPPQRYKLLADDWQCTESGPVSDIHIWGSWLQDRLPLNPTGLPDPRAVTFKLSIHEDIPAGTDDIPFSRPGPEVWRGVFPPGTFATRLYSELPVTVGSESFYDPNSDHIIGTDQQIWQYNFDPILNPYIQQVGKIYWLDVQADPFAVDPGTTPTYFGWKTTNPTDPRTPHFLDDAVFTDTAGFPGPMIQPWKDMHYPAGHPYAGQSIDLAFVITPEPGSAMLCGGAMLTLAMWRRRG